MPIFYRFMVEVHQSDPNAKTVVEGNEMPAIEARLFWHLFEGHKITLTRRGKDIVGFLIYEIPYPGIMLVRAMYADRRGAGSIKMYIDAVGQDTKKIFFQTRVANPPEQLLKATWGKRVVIHEGPELITWEMELEHGKHC